MKYIVLATAAFQLGGLSHLHASDLSRPLRETRQAIAATEAARSDLDDILPSSTPQTDTSAVVDVLPQTPAEEISVVKPEPLELIREVDVAIGTTRDHVISTWGEPRSRALSGNREVLHYQRGREVTLVDGLVTEVQGYTETTTRLQGSFDMDFKFDDEAFEQWVVRIEAWDNAMAGPIGLVVSILSLLAILMLFVSFWKIYVKAGEHGWAWLIPIYNIIVLLRIANKPLWWIVLLFIPFVGFIVGILIFVSFAQQFGKSALFGLGLVFLPYIFYPILAFGSAEYIGGEE